AVVADRFAEWNVDVDRERCAVRDGSQALELGPRLGGAEAFVEAVGSRVGGIARPRRIESAQQVVREECAGGAAKRSDSRHSPMVTRPTFAHLDRSQEMLGSPPVGVRLGYISASNGSTSTSSPAATSPCAWPRTTRPFASLMLRRIPDPCEPVVRTCQRPSLSRVTMPRWYSVRPARLRIGLALAARTTSSGAALTPLIASSASRTRA